MRNLGITLDSTLTLRTHVNHIRRFGSLSLHEIRKFYLRETPKGLLMPLFPLNWITAMACFTAGLPSSEIHKL